MNEPFMTGSHVYGTPTEESDVDVVMMMPPDGYVYTTKEEQDEQDPL